MTADALTYRRALAAVPQAVTAAEAAMARAEAAAEHAVGLAAQAEVEAKDRSKTDRATLDAHLRTARERLATVGHENLVPPRIRPSSLPTTATSTDVARAGAQLAAAVNRLRAAVDAASRPEPAAPAPATEPDLEPETGRRLPRAALIAAALAVVVLLVVLVVALG